MDHPEFLTLNHYVPTKDTSDTTVYTKTILASAQLVTGFGVFTVVMRPTRLLVHRSKGDNSYRFGIAQGKQRDISAAFAEDDFKVKLAEFEQKLNA